MTEARLDPGSFRDPDAYVFHDQGRVIRAVTARAAERFAAIYDSGVVSRLAQRGLMIDCRRLPSADFDRHRLVGARGEAVLAMYEHPQVPFISYPYEWCFSQLKAAALAHLDLQIAAFAEGYVLSDASAFNMQFVDGKPVHIDVSSLVPYQDGQPWSGYNQFCRQFLLPLLLEAWSGVRFQPFFRGSISGIDFADALSILPKRKLYLTVAGLVHVQLHGRAIAKRTASFADDSRKRQRLKPSHYLAILHQLRDIIAKLVSRVRPPTYWRDYASTNSYSEEMKRVKLAYVRDWAAAWRPATILDIGGNTGEFSRTALDGGAGRSILVDSDADAVEHAYHAANREILPILMDFLDPTPDLGWRQRERRGFQARARADGVIALAVLHHMVIKGNLPLDDVIHWLMALAPCGVIEFIPKDDPMVRSLLEMREDIFFDYSEEAFRAGINTRGTIVSEQRFPDNGRLLVSYVTR